MAPGLVASVLASTVRLIRRPALLAPTAIVSVGTAAAVHINGWPRAPLVGLPEGGALTMAILVWLAHAWFGLTLVGVAIALARGQRAGVLRNWVHVLRALEIGALSAVLLVPIAIGTTLLVLPGVYLLLRWSQVVPALVDRRVAVSGVLMFSETIASAYYLHILLIWVIVFGASGLIEWVAVSAHAGAILAWLPDAAVWRLGVGWAWGALVETTGIALMGALYVELDRLAFTRPVRL